MDNKYFSKIALQSTHRALNLMDRDCFSKTFGCFDRYYWHFKTKDFPSSSYQMGVEFLSRLWNLPLKDHSFYKNPQLLKWIKAGIEYTCSIQHKDGSFDEWYPNERGWAGPTSYVIHSLINAYKQTESALDEDLKKKARDCFFRASQLLLKQKEGAKLTNHFALFLLSLYEISQVIPESGIESDFEDYFNQLESLFSKEGWSIEYDSVDFGYNLATLSFLARLHRIYPEPLLKKYAEKKFYFLSYFFYPDGAFGGLGSRETGHLYPYALQYWAQSIDLARSIGDHLREKKSYENLAPSDQDDHYLFYRLSEYLEADEIKSEPETSGKATLPFLSKSPFKKYFPESGFFVRKSSPFYFVANMKKGGCLRIYNTKTQKCLLKNQGWIVKLKTKSQITNCWHSENNKIEITDNKISVSGKSVFFNQKYFNSLNLIVFRLISMTAKSYKIAFILKKLVRWLLIVRRKKSKYYFERSIQFKDNEIHILDVIKCTKAMQIFYGGEFSVRYVPQSNYFEISDLNDDSSIFSPADQGREMIIKQICDLENTITDLVVPERDKTNIFLSNEHKDK